MPTSSFHVLIIGGGLGGLCLAQGLKKVGISVAVFERDRTPDDRLQGYRIHIEPQGNRALYACLPPHLFNTYVATSGSGGNGYRIVTDQLKELVFFRAPVVADKSDPARSSRPPALFWLADAGMTWRPSDGAAGRGSMVEPGPDQYSSSPTSPLTHRTTQGSPSSPTVFITRSSRHWQPPQARTSSYLEPTSRSSASRSVWLMRSWSTLHLSCSVTVCGSMEVRAPDRSSLS